MMVATPNGIKILTKNIVSMATNIQYICNDTMDIFFDKIFLSRFLTHYGCPEVAQEIADSYYLSTKS